MNLWQCVSTENLAVLIGTWLVMTGWFCLNIYWINLYCYFSPTLLFLTLSTFLVFTYDKGARFWQQEVRPSPSPVLPGYVMVRQLGRGRSVWLAEETATGMRGRVAVRLGRREAVDGLLLREIVNLSRVRSQHVAAYRHCLRTADGACAVVTEYVDGEPLAVILARQQAGRLPWRRLPDPRAGVSSSEVSAGGVIIGVLRGLAALHTAEPPIVHRGVAPSNILVAGGRAVLTDLRLSALADGPASLGDSLPSSYGELLRGVVGTKGYMSPELAEGAVGLDGLDARADVWAAGVVLHEMLSGERLFPQVYILHKHKDA
jgi:serine/threonine protein kinase